MLSSLTRSLAGFAFSVSIVIRQTNLSPPTGFLGIRQCPPSASGAQIPSGKNPNEKSQVKDTKGQFPMRKIPSERPQSASS